ncbi:MAG: DUF6048 family protein [Nonlabens sp.]|nr:DUF6048 family protein [Nonlabens sp.]
MLRYVTSLVLFLTTLIATAQEPAAIKVNDSLTLQKTYGLRIGLDAASLIRTAVDDNYTGFQAIADYRVNSRWYAAGEIGTENVDQFNERIDATASGSFLKLGADYNFYQNWLEMDNMIYAGMRVGYATYSQELTRYDYYQDNTYFPIPTNQVNEEFNGLNAVWLEFQLGIKVEVLTNLYLGLNVQVKRTVTQGQPERFTNLYIPGFGRTYDTSNIGVGYSYGISYRIPLYKK